MEELWKRAEALGINVSMYLLVPELRRYRLLLEDVLRTEQLQKEAGRGAGESG